jgi:uncharacterized protein (UPF0262 family)
MDDSSTNDNARLVEVHLDPDSIGRRSPDIDHERQVAIYDLLESNRFALVNSDRQGPFRLQLAIADNRLVWHIGDAAGKPINSLMLSLTPFRRVIKDYFLICDSYYEAIRTAAPSRIEAIDMGRRGLHDEGSRLLIERLEGKIEIDFETARRLFTLLCALQWRGEP